MAAFLPPLQDVRVLSRVVLAEIVAEQPPRKLIKLAHSDTVEEALRVLAEHNILAAPVIIAPAAEPTSSASDSEPPIAGESLAGA